MINKEIRTELTKYLTQGEVEVVFDQIIALAYFYGTKDVEIPVDELREIFEEMKEAIKGAKN